MKAAIHGHLKQLFLADEIRCGMSLNTQTKGRASVLPRSPWAGRGHSVCEGGVPTGHQRPSVNKGSLSARYAQTRDGAPGPRLRPSRVLLLVYNQQQALRVT